MLGSEISASKHKNLNSAWTLIDSHSIWFKFSTLQDLLSFQKKKLYGGGGDSTENFEEKNQRLPTLFVCWIKQSK